MAAVEVFGRVEPFLGLVIGGDVGDDRSGEERLVLKGQKVGKGFERGPCRAESEGAVDLSAIGAGEVGRTVEGEDFTSRIVEDDECAVLDIFLAKSGELVGEDSVGFALQVGVDA
jgi:hypothetical protein